MANNPPDPAKDQNANKKVAKIPGRVLSDCIYGRVGEIKEFDADAAQAIAKAGYIDINPKAVKAADK